MPNWPGCSRSGEPELTMFIITSEFGTCSYMLYCVFITDRSMYCRHSTEDTIWICDEIHYTDKRAGTHLFSEFELGPLHPIKGNFNI